MRAAVALVLCAALAVLLMGAAPATAIIAGTKTLGAYVLIADDSDPVYTSTKVWTPQLYPYQQTGFNVLFLTFINPADMPSVPPGYAALAKSRGSGAAGAVPAGTTVIFSIGGELYSNTAWAFLASPDSATAMAEAVAQWPAQYGCDGIDIDIETGAGTADAGANLLVFVAKLKALAPAMIITQPVFGSPSSVPAADMLVEASFNASWGGAVPGTLNSVATVGIMVYDGEGSLMYMDDYVSGCAAGHCSQYYCPLPACVPSNAMLAGTSGGENGGTIVDLANNINAQNYGGIMVWFSSVLDSATGAPALLYGEEDDASNPGYAANQAAWTQGLKTLLGGSIAANKTIY